MEFKEIAEGIPYELRSSVMERLVDILLRSPNATKVPSRLVWALLFDWKAKRLQEPEGLKNLLEAAILAEPEKTKAFFAQEPRLARYFKI
ncbi:hypothetical protein KEJ19_04255 [Candidatus Bathyarchaeota archaeon]|nr:hypothetical protein [Candidatus Bathyarchaeota archaeon]